MDRTPAPVARRRAADELFQRAIVAFAEGDHLSAERDWSLARQEFAELELDDRVIDCTVKLGVVYRAAQRFEEAEVAYTQALAYYSAHNLHRLVANCTANLGNVFQSTGRFEEAEAAFTQARSYFAAHDLHHEAATCAVDRKSVV